MSAPSARVLPRSAEPLIDRLYACGTSSGVIAVVALVLVVLFQSFFWAPHVPLTLKIGALVIAVTSLWRPSEGLLVVAGLTPFGLMLTSRVFSANPGRITEAIVVSFLTGYAVRNAAKRLLVRSTGETPGPKIPAEILVPAVLFCVVTLASCVVHYGIVQTWQNHPLPFFERFIEFLLTNYHGDRGNYDPVASDAGFQFIIFGFFTVQSVALCLITCDLCQKIPTLVRRLVRMVVAGAVGASILSFVALLLAAANEPDLITALPELLERRWTMFTPKLNTAASLFVLAAPIALGATATASRQRFWWVASATVILGALWINGTRAALLAITMVLAATVIWYINRHYKRLSQVGLPVILGLIILSCGVAGVALQRMYSALAIPAAASLGYRYEFNKTAVLMLASSPIFGVGIDQYYLQSETFGSPDLPAYYRRVPAHNPFLQTAAELGFVGFIPFTWMLGATAWLGLLALRKNPNDKCLLGLIAGLAAFLLTTASSGHPLLIEVTAYTFWIVLGVGIAQARRKQCSDQKTTDQLFMSNPRFAVNPLGRQLLVVGTIVLTVSVPFRWIEAKGNIDYTQVSYGIHGWEQAGGVNYRWTANHATLFIDKTVQAIELPIRAPLIDTTGPMHVEVFLNGRLANRIDLNHSDWRPIKLELPVSEQRYHVLELQVSPTWFPKELLPGSTDPRELGIMIGQMLFSTGGTQSISLPSSK